MSIFENSFFNYIRQPTTLLGIGLTIAAFVGRLLKVLPEEVCITILSASLPLWISERKAQLQIGVIESSLIHDLGNEVRSESHDKT